MSGQERPRSRPKPAEPQTPEVWEDKQLSAIFRLSLKPEVVKDIHGHELHYVEGVRQDLEDENAPLLLKTSLLDQALTEAASKTNGQPLTYLLPCWKRVSRAVRGFRSETAPERQDVLKEARRLCMSYCIFAVTMPEMFGADTPLVNPLAKHLLEDPDTDRGIDVDFLSEATARFEEDESIRDALVGAVEQLSQELAKMSMNDAYKPYIMALRNVIRYPKLADAITKSPAFLPPDVPAQDIEKRTLLGPFFSLSPMQPEVAANYFSSPKTRDRGYITNAQNSLRMTLQTHQAELFDIANAIVKAGKEPREKMLDWFALTVNANHKRRAMRVDKRIVSSDGFMVNVTVSIYFETCGARG